MSSDGSWKGKIANTLNDSARTIVVLCPQVMLPQRARLLSKVLIHSTSYREQVCRRQRAELLMLYVCIVDVFNYNKPVFVL